MVKNACVFAMYCAIFLFLIVIFNLRIHILLGQALNRCFLVASPLVSKTETELV